MVHDGTPLTLRSTQFIRGARINEWFQNAMLETRITKRNGALHLIIVSVRRDWLATDGHDSFATSGTKRIDADVIQP